MEKQDKYFFGRHEFEADPGTDVEAVRKVIAERFPAVMHAKAQIKDNGDGTRTITLVEEAGVKG